MIFSRYPITKIHVSQCVDMTFHHTKKKKFHCIEGGLHWTAWSLCVNFLVNLTLSLYLCMLLFSSFIHELSIDPYWKYNVVVINIVHRLLHIERVCFKFFLKRFFIDFMLVKPIHVVHKRRKWRMKRKNFEMFWNFQNFFSPREKCHFTIIMRIVWDGIHAFFTILPIFNITSGAKRSKQFWIYVIYFVRFHRIFTWKS